MILGEKMIDGYIGVSPYRRKGFKYEAYIEYKTSVISGNIKLTLGFITYHILKFLHGKEIFHEMLKQRVAKLRWEINNGKE